MADSEAIEALKQGIDYWEKWRSNIPSPDLSDIDFNSVFKNTMIWDNFKNRIVLRRINLRNTNLSDSNLSNVILSNSNLSNAILSNAILDNAVLIDTNLIGADLNGTIFQNADLTRANLSNAILSKTNFKNATLHKTTLRNTDLSKTDLSKTKLYKTNLSEVNLEGANLSKFTLIKTNFSKANLSEVNLEGANLYKSTLYKANLEGTNLEDANLNGANLNGANLKGINLKKATINFETLLVNNKFNKKSEFTNTDFSQATIDHNLYLYLQKINLKEIVDRWSKNHPLLYPFVRLFWNASDYGYSVTRIIYLILGFSLLFCFIYLIPTTAPDWMPEFLTFNCDPIISNLDSYIDPGTGNTIKIPDEILFFRAFYFSIVTMTTLGFGDMYAYPNSFWGHVLIVIQVILGYILLGALITGLAQFSKGLFKSDD